MRAKDVERMKGRKKTSMSIKFIRKIDMRLRVLHRTTYIRDNSTPVERFRVFDFEFESFDHNTTCWKIFYLKDHSTKTTATTKTKTISKGSRFNGIGVCLFIYDVCLRVNVSSDELYTQHRVHTWIYSLCGTNQISHHPFVCTHPLETCYSYSYINHTCVCETNYIAIEMPKWIRVDFVSFKWGERNKINATLWLLNTYHIYIFKVSKCFLSTTVIVHFMCLIPNTVMTMLGVCVYSLWVNCVRYT